MPLIVIPGGLALVIGLALLGIATLRMPRSRTMPSTSARGRSPHLVQTPLQQEVRQQRVRVSAARATTTPNPKTLCSVPTHPSPVPTPSTQALSTTWARVVAQLNLPPERANGRNDVLAALPYDRQGWSTHPTEPSESWRDWEGSLCCGQAGDDRWVRSRWLDRGFPRPPPALRRSLA